MKALTNERKARNSAQTLPIYYPRQRWVRICQGTIKYS